MRFARTLRRRREARGFTQAALAKQARLSRIYVIRLERGKQDPTLGTVARLAKALGVTVTQLVK